MFWKSVLRVLFGSLWLADSVFKWLPGFHQTWVSTVPSWLTPSPFMYALALTETLVGLAIIAGFARKAVYVGAAVLALGIWGFGEAFGGPYDSSSTDVGSGLVYVMLALALLTIAYISGPSRFSVDSLIERKVSWWHRVAEVRS